MDSEANIWFYYDIHHPLGYFSMHNSEIPIICKFFNHINPILFRTKKLKNFSQRLYAMFSLNYTIFDFYMQVSYHYDNFYASERCPLGGIWISNMHIKISKSTRTASVCCCCCRCFFLLLTLITNVKSVANFNLPLSLLTTPC